MSLKRKASFSTPSIPFAPVSCEMDMVDSSKHLNSRTRKRFRDGRPNEEVVYGKTSTHLALQKQIARRDCYAVRCTKTSQADQQPAKTLRWIFSAQQQQPAVPMDTSEEIMEEDPSFQTPAPETETVDPRQHTLLRFFQPRAQPVPRFKPSREALVPRANETIMSQDEALRRAAFQQMNAGAGSTGSETSTGFNQDMDMNMDMDTDESSEGSNLSPNVGGMAWM
ncbi:hypothetical protein N7520_004989 [Penicillium odoratum]|uniref:uncharacterized protein n=1 Tax=Penicillium odoratum TaxID=1167516 RepID=UPI0025477087|nr:uncharacterized protein N7520_004989 [Penicillium odoratum]KAJ5765430.1 hypothetical protein N7520_004989 [Penicillium odoratum]